MADDETPLLRADATDDDMNNKPSPKAKKQAPVPTEEDSATVEPERELTCPVCGLAACFHNVAKT